MQAFLESTTGVTVVIPVHQCFGCVAHLHPSLASCPHTLPSRWHLPVHATGFWGPALSRELQTLPWLQFASSALVHSEHSCKHRTSLSQNHADKYINHEDTKQMVRRQTLSDPSSPKSCNKVCCHAGGSYMYDLPKGYTFAICLQPCLHNIKWGRLHDQKATSDNKQRTHALQ